MALSIALIRISFEVELALTSSYLTFWRNRGMFFLEQPYYAIAPGL